MSTSNTHQNTLPVEINLLDAFTNEPPKHDFVLPGLISGTVGSVIAPGGVGKSFFALEVAIAVATGHDITCGALTCENQLKGKVLYLPAEDMEAIIQGRLYWLGKYLNREELVVASNFISIIPLVGTIPYVHTSSSDNDARLNAESWAITLRELAEGKRLVIIDTLRRFHGCDENDGAAMTLLLQIIEVIAFETGATFIFLHHTNKASHIENGDGQGAARGSGVLSDNGRWQLNLVVMTKKEAKELKIKESERRNYIRVVQSKVNYSSIQDDCWLQRSEYGVLIPSTLENKKSHSKTKKRITRKKYESS